MPVRGPVAGNVLPWNSTEGYSRSSGADRARYFEYAVGSAREARDWYLSVVGVLPEEVVNARIAILNEILRILMAVIPRERLRRIERRKPRPE